MPETRTVSGSDKTTAGPQREPAAVRDYTTTVTILEAITEAIFILNGDGEVEYANRSGAESDLLFYTNFSGRRKNSKIPQDSRLNSLSVRGQARGQRPFGPGE